MNSDSEYQTPHPDPHEYSWRKGLKSDYIYSYLVGLETLLIYSHSLTRLVTKALVRLCGYRPSSESMLHAIAMSTDVSCSGSNTTTLGQIFFY